MSIAMDAACPQRKSRRNMQALQNETSLCLLFLLAGTILKLIYALRVPYNISPHDLGYVSDWTNYDTGHLSYIQFLFHQHTLVPSISGQFYHPPLFHIIGAMVFQLFYVEGSTADAAFELIQILNTLFACGISLVGYRILVQLGVTGKKLVLLTGFLSFCPTLYWLGVTLNNDCLMNLLQAMAIEQTIVWVHRPRTKEIVKIALLLALAMLTKTSAVLLAPAIGCVFLYEFIQRARQKSGVWELIRQFVIFALISIPLGTSFVLRNWICFAVKPNYVLKLNGVSSGQYLGDCSLWQRLGFPSLISLFSVRIHWDVPTKYSNLWCQTFLTMALDEGILHLNNVLTKGLGGLLIWSGCICILLLLCGFLHALRSPTVAVPIRLTLGVGAAVLFISYCMFAFQYPYVCSMNFRYMTNILVLLAAGYGLGSREPSTGIQILMWGYCLLTTALYLFCAT